MPSTELSANLVNLGLAVTPPLLAILVELFNPINEKLIRRSAETDLGEAAHYTTLPGGDASGEQSPPGGEPAEKREQIPFRTHSFADDIIGRTVILSTAAVEISGLAPTFVAVITSGFIVIHDLPNPFLPAVAYTVFFMGMVLFLLWVMSGSTLYEVGTQKIRIDFSGGLPSLQPAQDAQADEAKIRIKRGSTRQQIVRRFILFANILLIVGTIIISLLRNCR